MNRSHSPIVLARRLGAALLVGVLAAWSPGATLFAATEADGPFVVELSDVSAKVGQHAKLIATLKLRGDGLRLLEGYDNRVSRFSSLDDGVAFGTKVVPAEVRQGAFVFTIDVVPTKPGKHPINGVFRVGYTENGETMWTISIPLVASVTGAE
jgi:hypothetical protein